MCQMAGVGGLALGAQDGFRMYNADVVREGGCGSGWVAVLGLLAWGEVKRQPKIIV